MCNSKASEAKRMITGVMVLMMLATMLFSAFFIAEEADHDCTGEDCPICTLVEQCENTLRGFGGGILSQLSGVISVLFLLITAASLIVVLSQDTPVSRKVRLNN